MIHTLPNYYLPPVSVKQENSFRITVRTAEE